MSSACVAPMVVDDLRRRGGDAEVGEPLRERVAQARARRRDRRSAARRATRCARLAVARRSAVASIGASSHSAGSVPRPGIGRPPGGWNMPRISAVALIGSGRIGASGAGGGRAALARGSPLAHEEAALRRASTSPCACSWS